MALSLRSRVACLRRAFGRFWQYNYAFVDAFRGFTADSARDDATAALVSRESDGAVVPPSGYEIVRELGAGGCGVVYLARQTALQRLVALKRIHGYALTDDYALERFRREARVLATMDHPGVVRVFDFRRSQQDAMLVMEYVAGESLADRLDRGPMPVAESLEVLRDVAAALRAASERGIAHRDIKPGNVFLTDSGHAKLGDFGLARIVADPSVFRTTTGEVSGTPAYFPPECSDADHEPDERADAYSFAVMAYEMLTGRLPFTGADVMQVLAAHMSQPPPPPTDVVPGFPADASTALLTGLAKEPAARPLPWELVDRLPAGARGDRLAAVPRTAWPPVPDATPVRRRIAPSEPTVRGVVAPPSAQPARVESAPARRRPVRLRRLALPAAAAVAVGVALVVLTTSGGGSNDPPGDLHATSLHVSVSPGRGHCPGTVFTFTAEVATNGAAGEVSLQWTPPDGQRAQPVVG